MYHAIWPEGQPGEVRHFTSYWQARKHLFVEQFKMNLKFWRARRMRWARCAIFEPDPHCVEHRLKCRGAKPPPGGWVYDLTAVKADPEAHLGDCQCASCEVGLTTGMVYISTYAVI